VFGAGEVVGIGMEVPRRGDNTGMDVEGSILGFNACNGRFVGMGFCFASGLGLEGDCEGGCFTGDGAISILRSFVAGAREGG